MRQADFNGSIHRTEQKGFAEDIRVGVLSGVGVLAAICAVWWIFEKLKEML